MFSGHKIRMGLLASLFVRFAEINSQIAKFCDITVLIPSPFGTCPAILLTSSQIANVIATSRDAKCLIK